MLGVMFRPIPVARGMREVLQPRKALESTARQVIKAIDIEHYDLIHVHWAHPEGAIGARIADKHGIPFVLTLHGSDIHTLPQTDVHIRKQTLDTLHAADRAIFVSRALLDSARELGYDGRNAVVIPNGLSTAIFRRLPPDEVTRATGWQPGDGKVVGFIGSLNTVKRADVLPDIFEGVARLSPGTRFIVLGMGPLQSEFEAQTRKRGLNVMFPGVCPQDQVPAWMNLMDILILPSRQEGFPCVIPEAHACGVPVVGSSNGGIPEAVGDDGIIVQEGASFEQRFSDAVVEALKTEFPRAAIRERAQTMDWSVTAAREREIYQQVLTDRR